MIQTTLKIDGMMCSMCESHVNDAIRRAFKVKSVKSSHSKGETVIVSESELDALALEKAISEMGYKLLGAASEPYEKKGFFARFKK